MTRTVDPSGAVTYNTYDPNGNLLSTVDPLGRETRYTYDNKDNRLSATDPLGNTTRCTYNAMRRMTSLSDARGNTITNVFDAQGNLLEMRDPFGAVTRFTYNEQGQPTVMTDAAGHVTHFSYDLQGQFVREEDALGHVTDFVRDGNGALLQQSVTRTGAAGLETITLRFQYDAMGRLTNSVFPDGSSARTVYNVLGKPERTVDRLGRVTTTEYDEMGRVTRTVYPDGGVESSEYDAEGQRVASTGRDGQVTRYEYDAAGRLSRTLFPDGTDTESFFDAAGQLIASEDALGNGTFYGYDAAGRCVSVTNALGEVSLSLFDESGNLTNAVDALGRSTSYAYDALNRRVQTAFADGATQSVWFDVMGHRTHSQDQAGRVTAYGFDALGQLVAVTNALGYVTRYAYNEVGQQISQTDANGHTTLFEYDVMGNRVKRTLPGGQAETCAYDIGGRLTARTDFNGYTTAFEYDLMGRLVAKVPDPRRNEPSVTFAYDVLGLRTNMTDASGVTRYTYDTRHRLVRKSKTWYGSELPPVPFGIALDYAYDSNGNLTGIVSSDSSGAGATYEYDALNRLSAVSDPHVGRTDYAYDEVGNLAGCAYPNGVSSEYRYDELNRLTSLSSASAQTPVAAYAYTVGPAGNRLTAGEAIMAGGVTRTISRLYTYDGLYRLTGETIHSGGDTASLGYGYDAVGNRLSRQSTLAALLPQTLGYDANDRLTCDTYDENGNTLSGNAPAPDGEFGLPPETRTCAYDFENRLTRSVTADGRTVRIVYDGDGIRVAKTVSGPAGETTVFYTVDDRNPTGYAQVLEEHVSRDAGAPVIRSVYCYGHTLISQDRLTSDGQGGWAWSASFYGYDGHNSVRYLTDAAGVVTDTYDYDAFGNLIDRSGGTPNDYLFGGEQYDADLGLYYLRARYHNPDTGRFWTQDTYEGFGEDPSSLHKYTYCANNPVNASDPSGNSPFLEQMQVHALAPLVRGVVQKLFSQYSARLALGAMAGYIDARLNGYDPVTGAVGGAVSALAFGAVPAGAWMTPVGRVFTAALTALGATGVAISIQNKNYTGAIFRAALLGYGTWEYMNSQQLRVAMDEHYAVPCDNQRPAIVVGEGMDRVDAFAAELSAKGVNVRTYPAQNMNRTLNPNAYGSSKSLDANWHWLSYWVKGREAIVYYIGPQPGRVTRSPYFEMETRNLIRWESAGEIRPIVRIDPGY